MAVVGYMNFKRFFPSSTLSSSNGRYTMKGVYDNTAIRLIKRIRKKY